MQIKTLHVQSMLYGAFWEIFLFLRKVTLPSFGFCYIPPLSTHDVGSRAHQTPAELTRSFSSLLRGSWTVFFCWAFFSCFRTEPRADEVEIG